MKKYYLLGLMLLSSLAWLNAQDTTSIIASDRPMFGEAVSIVPHKSLQVETGFWYSEENTRVASTRGLGLNSTLLRYGIGKKWNCVLITPFGKTGFATLKIQLALRWFKPGFYPSVLG